MPNALLFKQSVRWRGCNEKIVFSRDARVSNEAVVVTAGCIMSTSPSRHQDADDDYGGDRRESIPCNRHAALFLASRLTACFRGATASKTKKMRLIRRHQLKTSNNTIKRTVPT